jgi:hypothetical protein
LEWRVHRNILCVHVTFCISFNNEVRSKFKTQTTYDEWNELDQRSHNCNCKFFAISHLLLSIKWLAWMLVEMFQDCENLNPKLLKFLSNPCYTWTLHLVIWHLCILKCFDCESLNLLLKFLFDSCYSWIT